MGCRTLGSAEGALPGEQTASVRGPRQGGRELWARPVVRVLILSGATLLTSSRRSHLRKVPLPAPSQGTRLSTGIWGTETFGTQ